MNEFFRIIGCGLSGFVLAGIIAGGICFLGALLQGDLAAFVLTLFMGGFAGIIYGWDKS